MHSKRCSLTEGSIWKAMLLFALPVLLGNIFQQLYNMVDTMIVGKYVGASALAAVGATGNLMFLITGFSIGFAAGFSIITAQAFGAGDGWKMRHSVSNGILLSLLTAVILTTVSLTCMDTFLHWMNTPSDIYPQARSYITIIAGFVTIVQLLVKAFVPALDASLGIFLPLIVVNCIILGRAESFSYKNGPVASFFDGIFQGIGYTLVLLAMCIIREFLGAGTFGGGLLNGGAGFQILPENVVALGMILPVGGFLTLGCLIAIDRSTGKGTHFTILEAAFLFQYLKLID